jgi:hypothetical protein
MMKRQIFLFVACALLATALACGDKSSPAGPSPASGGGNDSGATADGTTLKVTAPTPVSPANGSTLADNNVSLTITGSAGKFATVSPLAYRFQILLNGAVVKEFRGATLQWKLPTDLESNTSYAWRARAEQSTFFGPWSAEWTFKTAEQPEGYIQGGELYDPLTNGKTVGTIHGSVTFIPGVGARLNSAGSYIEYHMPQTVTGGEFSMLVTGMPKNTEGGKTKVMSMREGDSDITTNDRRFTIEKRGNPPGVIAWRVITSNDQIDTVGRERRDVDFVASRLYLFTASYGGGRFNLNIREGGASGRVIYNFGKGYRGVYDPNPQRVFVGGPAGRGGASTGSVFPMTARQVWLSSRDRPNFANK